MNWKKRWQLIAIFWLIFGQSAFASINMETIKHIESSGNSKAWNRKADARGLYQITPICLKEYNNFHSLKYNKEQLWNSEINTRIADWYLNVRIPQLLKHFHKEVNIRNIIICYNAGIIAVLKGYCPNETKRYIEKYNKAE
jgi:hypothetical protein